MPGSAPQSAAAAPIRASARSECRYGARLPARRPVPPGPPRVTGPASSRVFHPLGLAHELPRNHHIEPLASSDWRKTVSPASKSMLCAAPFSRLPIAGGHSNSSASGCAGPRPVARISPQVAWFPLPLSRPGIRPRGGLRFRLPCRPAPGERVWYVRICR